MFSWGGHANSGEGCGRGVKGTGWPGRGGGRGSLGGLQWQVGVVAGEQGGPSHLEDLGHVFRVPLLCDIAQLGRDIDSAADVHVHLHGLFLDLCVQVCHGLQGGQQGLRERGMEQAWGGGIAPRPLMDREGWETLGVEWEAPESEEGLELFLGMRGWASAARLGPGVEGPWEPKALAPSGQCETVCTSLPRAGRHPLSRHSVSVYFVRAKEKQRQLPPVKDFPSFPPSMPHLSPTRRCLPTQLFLFRIPPMADSPQDRGLPLSRSEDEPNGLHLEPQEASPSHTQLHAPQDQKPHQAGSPTIGLLLLSGVSPYMVPPACRWQGTWVPSRKEALAANGSPHPRLPRRALIIVQRTHTWGSPDFIKQPC